VEYLENIIPSSDEVDYSVISKSAGCPAPLFQRIFAYITGISINEYLRRRRLTLAGYDIRNSSEKIIDIGFQFPCCFYKSVQGASQGFTLKC
jgi:AraC family transcriptional regulator